MRIFSWAIVIGIAAAVGISLAALLRRAAADENAKMRRKSVLILYCICAAILLFVTTWWPDDFGFHVFNVGGLLLVSGLGLRMMWAR
jgi:hypothetical protein